jgi:hypothetical protein
MLLGGSGLNRPGRGTPSEIKLNCQWQDPGPPSESHWQVQSFSMSLSGSLNQSLSPTGSSRAGHVPCRIILISESAFKKKAPSESGPLSGPRTRTPGHGARWEPRAGGTHRLRWRPGRGWCDRGHWRPGPGACPWRACELAGRRLPVGAPRSPILRLACAGTGTVVCQWQCDSEPECASPLGRCRQSRRRRRLEGRPGEPPAQVGSGPCRQSGYAEIKFKNE